MKHLHIDERLASKINCAGEQEEEAVGMYATEVTISISVPTGQLAADNEFVAREVAVYRALQQVQVRGNGCSVECEAHVKRIGTA